MRARQVVPTLFCVALLGAADARAGELGEPADEPSAFATVIEARDWDDRFATVEDLLEQVPGVHVRRFGGLGAYSTASIRGAKPEQVLVLLDGVRLNEASRGAADLSTLPLRQVERIEVLRGAGAQRYGSDAVGGVISITTRRPESAALSLDSSLTGGRYGTLGGDVGVSGASERARGLVSYTRLRSDNDYDFSLFLPDRIGGGRPGAGGSGSIPTSFTRENAQFVEDSGLLRGGFDTGAHSHLDAMLDLYRKDAGEPGSIWTNGLSGATDESLSCLTADRSGDRGVASLGWTSDSLGARGEGGALELAASGRIEDGELEDPGGACGLLNPLVTGSDSSSWREQSSALDGRWRWPEVGGSFARVRGQLASSLRYDTVDTSDGDLERRTTVLVSLLPELALFDRVLRVLPGLAFEQASTSDGLVRSAASQPLVRFSPRDETAWLPGVGGILELAPGLRLQANWKRVMRRPTFTELFHPDWGEIRGNPALRAERGWNGDVGFELDSPGRGAARELRIQADVFQRELDQGIEWVYNVNNAFMPLNTGRSRALGAEVSLGGKLFERLTLDATYTYTSAHYLGSTASAAALQLAPERRLPHVPEHAATLRAGLALGPTRAFGELRYESEIVFMVGNTTVLPAAFQVDAGLELRPHEVRGLGFFPAGITLSVEGDNLTSEQRYDSLGLPLPKRALWLVRIRASR